jgi:hypothetical protein
MGRCACLPLAAAATLLAGCAAAPAEPAGDRSWRATAPAEQEYEVSATVLESPDHGPQLCEGVLLSDPPQCSGPDVLGWDWEMVEGEVSSRRTTSGEYHVVGTWDGEALTLTEPPREPRNSERSPQADSSTPCKTPDGGWAVVDPATTTWRGYQAAVAYAEEQDGLGSVWVDRHADVVGSLPMSGFEEAVLNVTFSGDPERHERELRARYGGPLCVLPAEHSATQLRALQGQVNDVLRGTVLATSVGIHGRVRVRVPVADQEVRNRVADIDPAGLVDLTSWLRPVP